MTQEIARNAVLMARKTQSFSFQKHIENEASSFRLHPFMGLLIWALQLDLHAFRGQTIAIRATSILTETTRRVPKPFVKGVVLESDTDPLVEGPDFSVCQQLSL